MNPILAHQMLMAGGALWTPLNLATLPNVWINDTSSYGASLTELINGYTFVTTVTPPSPITAGLNGKRTIRGNGTSDNLISTNAGALAIFKNVSAGYMLFVYKKAVATGSAVIRPIAQARTAPGSGRFVVYAGSSSSAVDEPRAAMRRLDADSAGVVNCTTHSGTTWHMLLVLADWANGTCTFWLDGATAGQNTSITTHGSTSNTSADELCLFSEGTSTFGDVELGDVLMGGAYIPTSTEIDKLFGYEAYYWGLQANLPSGHPYKHSPPYV